MAVSYMDFTSPSTQYTYTLSDNPFFQKDAQNFINTLSVNQLNTLGNASLLDIFLSKDNVVEPHIHQNATELVYCITGGAVVSLINPFTKELLNFTIGPGQVANVPQGWWHYEIANQDNTHLLAIFDAPVPEVIFGSDILRLTPAHVLAHSYCLDEAKVKDTLAPITDSVIIGPPASCSKQNASGMQPMGYPMGQLMNQGNYGSMNTSQTTPAPYQQGNQNQTYHYPYRPISEETVSSYTPLDQPFHPIPFLYRRWG
ncbi:cupin domain-containing protein [Paenibacillus pinisoli]|uniref:Cupin domain-containing protein n=1 Tax=Paenibacillus pinisoli TaxID=1276110 RepID=A0A3A6PJV3_9BACL|nr:cupin domain-containing protein [Paenibacillus pinisoli]RJX38579.1 cupin domain-containing protein [Paenibacillus pinisoli]